MQVHTLIVLLTLGTAGPITAQRTYLGPTLEPTTKGKAVYYKEPDGMVEGAYKARIHTMDGRLKAEGLYADKELKVPNGSFTYFHPNGKVESTGTYEMGLKTGVWQRYDEWGTALAEKVYDPAPIRDIVYAHVTTMPVYPGGQKELVRYIRNKVDDAKLEDGTAVASFVVEKDGRLSDVKVETGNDQVRGLIEQALAESPKWQVGENGGVPVRVSMRMPIKF